MTLYHCKIISTKCQGDIRENCQLLLLLNGILIFTIMKILHQMRLIILLYQAAWYRSIAAPGRPRPHSPHHPNSATIHQGHFSNYTVETGTAEECRKEQFHRSSLSHGFISYFPDQTWNNPECPWVLETQPGQTLNITIYNFARSRSLADRGQDAGEEQGQYGVGYGSVGETGRSACFQVAEIVGESLHQSYIFL